MAEKLSLKSAQNISSLGDKMVMFAFMFTLHYAIDLYQNVRLQRSAENTSSLGDKMVMFACMLTLHHVDDRYLILSPPLRPTRSPLKLLASGCMKSCPGLLLTTLSEE